MGRRSHPQAREFPEVKSPVEQFDLPDPLSIPKHPLHSLGTWQKLGYQDGVLENSPGQALRGPRGTFLSKETRNDPWTVTNFKNNTTTKLCDFYPLGIHLSPHVLTQSNAATSCCMWQSLSTLVQGRENCSGQLFFENVPNKRTRACLGDMAHH